MERTVRAGVVDLQKGILTVNLDKRSLLCPMPSGFEQVAGWEFEPARRRQYAPEELHKPP
jgi:hypothetical protein